LVARNDNSKQNQMSRDLCDTTLVEQSQDLSVWQKDREQIFGTEADLEAEVVSYTKTIELNPKNADAYLNRGDTYRTLGLYHKDYTKKEKIIDDFTKKAIDDYTKAIDLDPKNTYAYLWRASAYGMGGEHRKAIDDYTNLIKINPNNALFHAARGGTYKELGEYQKAIENFNRAIKLSPEPYFAYRFRGDSYAELGEYQKAIDDYTKAIELDPSVKKYAEALERDVGLLPLHMLIWGVV